MIKQIINGFSWGALFLLVAWAIKSNFDFEPLIGLVIALGAIIATFEKRESQDEDTLKFFPKSDSPELHELLGASMKKADKVILIGIGLNVLKNEPLRLEIMKLFANSKRKLEIYLADPYGIDVERRFIEEETGEDKPSVGRKGLISKINTLLKNWENLGYHKSIEIRLFSNYLTFALLIIDKDYYFYPYAHAKIGNYSPVLKFSKSIKKHDNIIDFLDEQHNSIKDVSKDAKLYYGIKINRTERSIDKLIPAAVYFIPPENSDLYKFGSELLGYDIYARKNIKSIIEKQHIGNAKDYGFHLTICDALFFFNNKEIREIEEELEFVLNDIAPFFLTNFELNIGFPNHKSISLKCQDLTGTMSLIHYELVNRIYRKSVASNYTMNLAKFDRGGNEQRQKLYTSWYNAPYILEEFVPHFTLGSEVTIDVRDELLANVKTLFHQKVKDNAILVEKVAILLFDIDKNHWFIHKEIFLKKN